MESSSQSSETATSNASVLCSSPLSTESIRKVLSKDSNARLKEEIGDLIITAVTDQRDSPVHPNPSPESKHPECTDSIEGVYLLIKRR